MEITQEELDRMIGGSYDSQGVDCLLSDDPSPVDISHVMQVTSYSLPVIEMWNGLMAFLPISLNGMLLARDPTLSIRSFEGICIFTSDKYILRYKDVDVRVRMSDRGLTELDFKDLAVRTDRVMTINGSGNRMMTEFWEKKDGYPFLTIQLVWGTQYKNLALYFNPGKRVYFLCEVDTFLLYSGEMIFKGSDCEKIYVHESCPRSLLLKDHKGDSVIIKVDQLNRYCFSQKTIPIIKGCREGIVVVVDGTTFRIKHQNTLDLEVRKSVARTREGTVIFKDVGCSDGIHEFTKEGRWLRSRKDKMFSDSDHKKRMVEGAATLDQLILLLGVLPESNVYVPSQHVSYDVISAVSYGSEVGAVAREVCAQVWASDNVSHYERFQEILDQFLLDRKSQPSIADFSGGFPLISSCIKDGFFGYRKYIVSLTRMGGGVIYENFKKFLSKLGIMCEFGQYRVATPSVGTGRFDIPYVESGIYTIMKDRVPRHYIKNGIAYVTGKVLHWSGPYHVTSNCVLNGIDAHVYLNCLFQQRYFQKIKKKNVLLIFGTDLDTNQVIFKKKLLRKAWSSVGLLGLRKETGSCAIVGKFAIGGPNKKIVPSEALVTEMLLKVQDSSVGVRSGATVQEFSATVPLTQVIDVSYDFVNAIVSGDDIVEEYTFNYDSDNSVTDFLEVGSDSSEDVPELDE